MADYVLSCESTIDLTPEEVERAGLEYVPFTFTLDGREYPDDLGQTVPYDKFYQALVDGAEVSTTAMNAGEYDAYFRPFLEAGRDVLHVTLSSGLSSTYDDACVAAEELSREFPERTIYVVDSLAASSGYGMLMVALSELRAQGMSLEDAYDWTLEHRLNLRHEFFSTDLTFYIKGGRVKPAAGLVGNILKICPVMHMDALGHLIPTEKVRTKKKAAQRIVEKMAALADGGTDYDGRVFMCESACMDDALELRELVKKRFPKVTGEIPIHSIGTVIGCHSGPGTLALFFWGKKRD